MTAKGVAIFLAIWFAIGLAGAVVFGMPDRSNYACLEKGSTWGKSGQTCARYGPKTYHPLFPAN